MKHNNNTLYLEGTESILNHLTSEDKDKILKFVSGHRNRDPQAARFKLKKTFLDTLTCKKSIAIKAVTTTHDFYTLNIPKNFKKIKDGNDLINESGELYSYSRRPINTSIDYKGYVQVHISLYDKMITTKVHRLVGLAFIPNPENKPQINHIDGNKRNNHMSNLEWNTNLENIRHATRTGLRNTDKMKANGNGEKNSQALIGREDVKYIRSTHKETIHQLTLELSKKFSVSYGDIESVRDYKNKHPIARYTYPDKVRNSRNLEVLMDVDKLCCDDSNHYIRGKFNILRSSNNKVLSKKYNVSLSTIRDILSRRSWDYEDC